MLGSIRRFALIPSILCYFFHLNINMKQATWVVCLMFSTVASARSSIHDNSAYYSPAMLSNGNKQKQHQQPEPIFRHHFDEPFHRNLHFPTGSVHYITEEPVTKHSISSYDPDKDYLHHPRKTIHPVYQEETTHPTSRTPIKTKKFNSKHEKVSFPDGDVKFPEPNYYRDDIYHSPLETNNYTEEEDSGPKVTYYYPASKEHQGPSKITKFNHENIGLSDSKLQRPTYHNKETDHHPQAANVYAKEENSRPKVTYYYSATKEPQTPTKITKYSRNHGRLSFPGGKLHSPTYNKHELYSHPQETNNFFFEKDSSPQVIYSQRETKFKSNPEKVRFHDDIAKPHMQHSHHAEHKPSSFFDNDHQQIALPTTQPRYHYHKYRPVVTATYYNPKPHNVPLAYYRQAHHPRQPKHYDDYSVTSEPHRLNIPYYRNGHQDYKKQLPLVTISSYPSYDSEPFHQPRAIPLSWPENTYGEFNVGLEDCYKCHTQLVNYNIEDTSYANSPYMTKEDNLHFETSRRRSEDDFVNFTPDEGARRRSDDDSLTHFVTVHKRIKTYE